MEYGVMVVAVARRRWLQFVVPVILILAAGAILAKLAPKVYSTKSLILLQSANRSTGLTGPQSILAREAVLQQISAIDSWIKSDQVLQGLLPKLVEGKQLQGDALITQMRALRLSLNMELIGNSTLEIRLEGPEARGLARKLEIIIERIMDGLTGPEQSILNASQFISMRRTEELRSAEVALEREIFALGYADPGPVVARLKQVAEIKARSNGAGAGDAAANEINVIRQSISRDGTLVAKLEALYGLYHEANLRSNRPRGATRSSGNYFGIFDTPENLLLVGRPQDPLYGENSGRKPIIGLIILAIMSTAGVLIFLELVSGRARLQSEFETLSGVPVVARFPRL
jgi:hypothetical protein